MATIPVIGAWVMVAVAVAVVATEVTTAIEKH